MKRIVVAALGALLVLVGAVWTLQGVGILRGSAMSGHARWAILGPVVVLAGIVLLQYVREHRH